MCLKENSTLKKLARAVYQIECKTEFGKINLVGMIIAFFIGVFIVVQDVATQMKLMLSLSLNRKIDDNNSSIVLVFIILYFVSFWACLGICYIANKNERIKEELGLPTDKPKE